MSLTDHGESLTLADLRNGAQVVNDMYSEQLERFTVIRHLPICSTFYPFTGLRRH